MPTDLELIEQLEKEIGIELTEKETDSSTAHSGAYQRDSDGHVIRLAINGGELTEFPDTILRFKNLDFLSLHHNQLTTLPPEIRHFVKLRKLYLSINQLNALPPEVTKLKNLTTMYL